MSARESTELFRSDVTELTKLARRDLQWFLASLHNRPLDEVRDVLTAAVPDLAQPYISAAGDLSADWYSGIRADAGLSGYVPYVRAQPIVPAQARAMAGWAVDPLRSEPGTLEQVAERVSGAVARAVFNAARETIVGNASSDPRALGFQRLARPGACAFCGMLASRGAAYKTASSAGVVVGRGGSHKTRGSRALGEKYHDNCHCIATPIFPGSEVAEVAQADQAKFEQMYARAVEASGSTRTADVLRAWRQVHGTH